MGAKPVNGSGNRARSGAQTLLLLAAPLNVLILQALTEGPKGQAELLRATGSPAQSTLRTQLNRLVVIGVVEKQRRNRFPGVMAYGLTQSGRDVLLVVDALEKWLAEAPGAPLTCGATEAKAAIKALAEGWSSTLLRAIAAGPRTLTELDGVIASLNYPSLERRLSAMRLAGLVSACPGDGRGTPYAVTGWLRQGVGPLMAAIHWERHHQREAVPVGPLDAETAFLLATPLLRLPAGMSGSCRLAVEIPHGNDTRLSGAVIEISDGIFSSCVTQLRGKTDAWVLGTLDAWLNAVIDSDFGRLGTGGDRQLATAVLEGLRRSPFGRRLREPGRRATT